MHGYVAKYRYENKTILNSIYSTLPMDEFLQGNFSRAREIADQAGVLILECFREEQKRCIGDHKDIKSFIEFELEKCLSEKEKLETERETLTGEIETYKKLIIELEKYCNANNIKKAIYQKFKELNYNTEEMTDFMEKLSYSNIDNYNKAINDYNEMIAAPEYLIFSQQSRSYEALLKLRKENTEKLSHKGNMSNMTRQVEELKNGERAHSIYSRTNEKVDQAFQKRDGTGTEIDDRNLQTIYKETLLGRLVVNRNTPAKQKHRILTNISDKVGLFHYLNDLYFNLYKQERTLKISSEGQSGDQIRIAKIDSVVRSIKDAVVAINSQVWSAGQKIRDEDVTYIENLFRGPKHGMLDRYEDKILHGFFKLVETHYETTDLEDKFTELWNYDFWQIDHDKQGLIQMCGVILDNMSVKERELIGEDDAQRVLGPYVRQKNDNNPQGNMFDKVVFDGMIKKRAEA